MFCSLTAAYYHRFAVRVQMPLTHDITVNNGPTIMCPGSHTEMYCQRYLKECDAFFPLGEDPDQEKRPLHRNAQHLVWDADVCSPYGGRRATGTGKVGDVLIYDGRLVHAGGHNNSPKFRDIVAISCVEINYFPLYELLCCRMHHTD